VGRSTYITYFCNGLEKVLNSWKYSGINEINLQMTRDQIYYRVQIGSKIEKNITLKNLNYYQQFTIKAKELILPEEETNFQVFDLELNSTLITKGDVIGIRQACNNPYVTFIQRINKVKQEDLNHKHQLSYNNDYTIKRSNNHVPIIVTDEYVMRGNDIQNNIFYYRCSSIRARVYTEDNADFHNTFLCMEKGLYQFFITDFLEIKIGVELDRKEFYRPYLIKVGNFLFLLVQTYGTSGVTVYKFTFNEYIRDTLKPIFKEEIRISDFSSNLHEMDFYFAMYNKTQDKIFLIIKEMHATSMSIRAISVDDNHIDYSNVNWITFKDGVKKKLYFTYCSPQDEDIICTARSAKKIYILKISYDIDWTVNILYKMDPHYTFNNMIMTSTTMILHEYMAFILTTRNIFQVMEETGDHKKWPLVTIYRLNKDTKKGEIYGVLFWEDFRDENFTGYFALQDLLLVKKNSGEISLTISAITSYNSPDNSPKLFRVYEFSISSYKLKYDLRSLRFRDSIDLIGFDYDSNIEKVTIPILIKTNQKIFMYMMFNTSLVLIFTILIIVICYFYSQNKKERADQMESNSESMESHDIHVHEETDESENPVSYNVNDSEDADDQDLAQTEGDENETENAGDNSQNNGESGTSENDSTQKPQENLRVDEVVMAPSN
jgi:hypothetical protein